MLGWQIYINRQTIKNKGTCESSLRNEALLATWVTGINGCEWIDNLVKQGKVEELPGDFCIRRYSVEAKVLLPIIGSLPKKYHGPIVVGDDYVHLGGFNYDIEIYQSRIDECSPNEFLSIETWDQS